MKKIWILSAVLLFLAVASFWVYFNSTVQPKDINPIRTLPISKIVLSIPIDVSLTTVTIASRDTYWMITTPFEDIADDRIVDSMLMNLHSFKVGAPISENPARYDQFRLTDAQAVHVQVFTDGKSEPIMNGYLGGPGTNNGSSYFRFYGQPQVYMAANLDGFDFRKPPELMRSHKWLPRKLTEATSVRFEGKVSLNIEKSSPTWINHASTVSVPAAWATTLVGKLDNIYVNSFASPGLPDKETGLNTPAIRVTVSFPDKTTLSGFIGRALPAPKPQQQPANYYAKSEGRSTVLLLNDPQYTDLLIYVNSLK
jgi:hypothetical protein